MAKKKTASPKSKPQPIDKNTCRVCGKPILVSIFKNSGLCSLNCDKIEKGEKVASPVVAETDCVAETNEVTEPIKEVSE